MSSLLNSRESTETNEGNRIFFLKSTLNSVNKCVQSFFAISLSQLRSSCDSIYQFTFIHNTIYKRNKLIILVFQGYQIRNFY